MSEQAFECTECGSKVLLANEHAAGYLAPWRFQEIQNSVMIALPPHMVEYRRFKVRKYHGLSLARLSILNLRFLATFDAFQMRLVTH